MFLGKLKDLSLLIFLVGLLMKKMGERNNFDQVLTMVLN